MGHVNNCLGELFGEILFVWELLSHIMLWYVMLYCGGIGYAQQEACKKTCAVVRIVTPKVLCHGNCVS